VAPIPEKRVHEEAGTGLERVPGTHGGRVEVAGMGEPGVVPLTTCEDSVLSTYIKIKLQGITPYRISTANTQNTGINESNIYSSN
jgi:hypothetical protein